MAQVGVGFIGAGDVAYLHKLALLQVPTAKVVAVFDVDEVKSKNLASDLGAKVCRSADELVSLPEVQVVYVLTPEPAHHENVMRSLRAGKHTFVEKLDSACVQEEIHFTAHVLLQLSLSEG